jgi:hypothetical protein
MEKPTVATPSPRMAALAAKRTLVNDLMGGTFAMRAAGAKWLPKHPAESDGVYKTRLEKTFLNNFLGDAISKGSGKIFAKPIKLAEIPIQIEDLIEDIDLQGSGLDAFAQEVGKLSLQDGITYVLVDVPPADGVKTVAEEKAAGIRPYCVHINPDNVIEILSAMVGGREVIKRVRIAETSTASDGEWGYSTVDRVRVLEMRSGVMCFDVYEKQKDKDGAVVWVPMPELSGTTTFPGIFLVPFYSNRTGFMEGEPGFQNIAESTLEHWQWKSEHAHALSMCCFGMYTATGVDADFQMVVGPAKTLVASNPEARFDVVETTGKGVELAEKALQAIEARIETAGVNLRVENAGQVTATAASIDSAETNAGIVAVANGFADSWEQVFCHMATIMGLGEDSGGEVEICTDTGRQKGTQAGLTEIGKARALGDLSAEAYVGALVWRGELPEDFDLEANAEACAMEGPALGDMTKPAASAGKGGDCSAMGASACCCSGCPNEAKAGNDKCPIMGKAGCCCKGCPLVDKSSLGGAV